MELDPSMDYIKWLEMLDGFNSNSFQNIIADELRKRQAKQLLHTHRPSTAAIQSHSAIRRASFKRLFNLIKWNGSLRYTEALAESYAEPILQIADVCAAFKNKVLSSVFPTISEAAVFASDLVKLPPVKPSGRTAFYKQRLQTQRLPVFRLQKLTTVFTRCAESLADDAAPVYDAFRAKIATQLNEVFNYYRLRDECIVSSVSKTLPSSGVAPYEGIQNLAGALNFLADSQVEIYVRLYQLHLYKLFEADELGLLVGTVRFILEQTNCLSVYEDLDIDINSQIIKCFFGFFPHLTPRQVFICLDKLVQTDIRAVAVITSSILILKAGELRKVGEKNIAELIISVQEDIEIDSLLRMMFGNM